MKISLKPIAALVLALGLGAGGGALAADTMTRDAYKAEKDRSTPQYKSAKAACDSLSGNAKDICKAEAKGKEKIAEGRADARIQGHGQGTRRCALGPRRRPHTKSPRRNATTWPAMPRTSA